MLPKDKDPHVVVEGAKQMPGIDGAVTQSLQIIHEFPADGHKAHSRQWPAASLLHSLRTAPQPDVKVGGELFERCMTPLDQTSRTQKAG